MLAANDSHCRMGDYGQLSGKRASAYATTAAGVAGSIHLARPDREVQALIVAWRILPWLV